MSPYTSIKDVSRSLLGKLSFLLTPIVYERFRNIDSIKDAKCPVFFLHGLKDKLIPHSHSELLNKHCPTPSFMQLPTNMDHNEFDFIDDLVNPFKEFIRKIEDSHRPLPKMGDEPKEEVKKEDDTYFEGPVESQKESHFLKQKNEYYDEDEDIHTHQSDIDNSFVDFNKKYGTFEINFEKKLYDPP